MNRPRITYKSGKLKVSEDPIIRKVGEDLQFELFADLSQDSSILEVMKHKYLKWQVYFNNGNPFHSENTHLNQQVTIKSDEAPLHAGIIDMGKVRLRGEYKYGIKIFNTKSKSKNQNDCDDLIEDFDPILIVI